MAYRVFMDPSVVQNEEQNSGHLVCLMLTPEVALSLARWEKLNEQENTPRWVRLLDEFKRKASLNSS